MQTRRKTRSATEIQQLLRSTQKDESETIDNSNDSEQDFEEAVSPNELEEDAELEIETSSDDDLTQEAQRAKKSKTTSTATTAQVKRKILLGKNHYKWFYHIFTYI